MSFGMEHITDLMQRLNTCDTSEECVSIARDLAGIVKQGGLECLEAKGILEGLRKAMMNKKSGLEREAGLIGIAQLAAVVGKPLVPYLLFPQYEITLNVLELHSDKGEAVREAAYMAMSNITALVEPRIVRSCYLPVLLSGLSKPKWQIKIACLEALQRLASQWPDQTGLAMPELVPAVTDAMHDTKQEVSRAAIQTMTQLCAVVGNPDINPHIALLVECMAHPDKVMNTVQKLSATTFVAEVTAAALAVMVPLLVRALGDRSAATVRPTVVIADNLFKLVRVPADAGQFMPQLMPGLDRIVDAAAFPEIRALATAARNTLLKASDGSNSDSHSTSDALVLGKLREIITSHLKVFLSSFFTPILQTCAYIAVSLIEEEEWDLPEWDSLLSPYLSVALSSNDCRKAIAMLHKYFHGIFQASQTNCDDEDEADGEVLCDCKFSLAYGGMMLLNHTRLRLKRGQRYGLCGHNGAGKSTLMRAISLGKVDGFPAEDQLRTVFVEHSLQGEEASLSVIDFIASDKRLSAVSRKTIVKSLFDVGFDETRQSQPVGALSGGWKMKLELARAMLMKADILLLDEPTNHLDVANIAWLQEYICSQPNVTFMIVSHDSSFLDHVCTYIIHYEKKKLVYYKGNLSKFVERRPEAKSYYTLAATSIKFSFPPPSVLVGIRSNTKAILKMTNVTYTYPGAPKPSIMNASVQLSLSSRVAVIGPNGAGKSTMIKVLTGEAIPQEGLVWKHPNLRVGYVAQHAFHHLEQHLEKTPNQYIQWRYQGGQDREILEKATRKFTDEDLKQLETRVEINGDSRRIECLLGRQKLKKSFQYEVKWVGMPHKHNSWLPRDQLLEMGFSKLVQAFDDQEASREGQGYRELVPSVIRKHIEEVGLDGDIADNNPISGLSGGQKVKVVLAAAMWNNPHMLVLDEPTNYLDRESLGGLAVAIRDWGGAVIMISHNTEFVSALCPESWHVEAGRLTMKGKSAVQEDNFEDSQEKIDKKLASKPKKKKLTRNEKKDQEIRRRARHLKWLAEGGQKEPDTESD